MPCVSVPNPHITPTGGYQAQCAAGVLWASRPWQIAPSFVSQQNMVPCTYLRVSQTIRVGTLASVYTLDERKNGGSASRPVFCREEIFLFASGYNLQLAFKQTA